MLAEGRDRPRLPRGSCRREGLQVGSIPLLPTICERLHSRHGLLRPLGAGIANPQADNQICATPSTAHRLLPQPGMAGSDPAEPRLGRRVGSGHAAGSWGEREAQPTPKPVLG